LDPRKRNQYTEHFKSTFGGTPSGAKEHINEEVLWETSADNPINLNFGLDSDEFSWSAVREKIYALPNGNLTLTMNISALFSEPSKHFL
jgi:hypothetical protein